MERATFTENSACQHSTRFGSRPPAFLSGAGTAANGTHFAGTCANSGKQGRCPHEDAPCDGGPRDAAHVGRAGRPIAVAERASIPRSVAGAWPRLCAGAFPSSPWPAFAVPEPSRVYHVGLLRWPGPRSPCSFSVAARSSRLRNGRIHSQATKVIDNHETECQRASFIDAASLTKNAVGVRAHGKLRSRIFWPRKNSSTASDSP